MSDARWRMPSSRNARALVHQRKDAAVDDLVRSNLARRRPDLLPIRLDDRVDAGSGSASRRPGA
jgi:hypothetical protein